MSWTTPTELDLQASLSHDELVALQEKGVDTGQAPAAQIIARTVDLVRGYVRRAGVALGAAGTLPPELLAPAMDIAAVDWFLRLNLEVKQPRLDRRRDALSLLRDMAAGKGIQVSGPADDAVAAAAPSPSITSIARSRGRAYEDGI